LGEKIYYNSRDIECFLGDYFLLARPVHQWCSVVTLRNVVIKSVTVNVYCGVCKLDLGHGNFVTPTDH